MALNVGDNAPDFVLPGDTGVEISLASFKGRKLVLYVYPKDDTSGCTAEAIDFNRLKPAFSDAGIDIVGVSADSVKRHANFKQKYSLDIALASDEEKNMLNAYGVWIEKSMYGRKYMGIERTTFLIDAAGRISAIWNKVKVPGHVQEVLDVATSN